MWDRRVRVGVTASLLCLMAATGAAQQLQLPGPATPLPSLPSTQAPATGSPSDSTQSDRLSTKNEGGSLSINSNGTLTASQIITIVQARPELIVDVKQVMADYLEQQGNPVQTDSITDDMLYKAIGADAGLRGAISIWLRARGYVSESDFDRSDQAPTSSNEVTDDITTTALGLPNSLVSGVDTGSARIDRNLTQGASSSSDVMQGKRNVSKQPEGRDTSLAAKPDRNHPNAVEVVHQTAPYNLQSLRDLYTQVPEQTSKLKRFGSDMFSTH